MNQMTEPGLQSIHVVLVHHGICERVAEARKTVLAVKDALSEFGEVQVGEVSAQPATFRVGAKDLVLRSVRQWRLERRWARHLGVTPRWVLSTGLLGLRLLQLTLPGARRRASQRSFIELALSAKHELAWRRAYQDGADVLVVLEDDARHVGHSAEQIRALVRQARSEGALEDTYVDLAGGVSTRELRIGHLEVPRDGGIVRLAKGTSNTACGYLVGRRALERLAALTIRDPASGRLPADWVLNLFFMEAANDADANDIICLHSHPHALRHGSFTGDVASSIRGKG